MSELRCEFSDLPAEQCACEHCKPPVVIRRTKGFPSSSVIARFLARFDSDCDVCGEQMTRGEPICRTEGGDYCHEACAEGDA